MDMDGDGYRDRILSYNPFDTREGFRKSFTAKQLDHELRFHFFNPQTGFSDKPQCRRKLVIHLNERLIALTIARQHSLDQFVGLNGDFDGDGDKDLLIRDRQSRVSAYAFGGRDSGFSNRVLQTFACRSPIERIRTRDLNEDGISDLILMLDDNKGLKVFTSRR